MQIRTVTGPLQSILAMLCMLFATQAAAETMTVRVVDVDQQPVADVAVFVTQHGAGRALRQPVPAVMDQRDKRFVPHVLIVQTGAAVEFPNSDVIAHHVYSFSRPNDFVLPLYKGTPPGPVVFEHDGIVTLGCNIHDSMLGYVVVVDTDVFAKTDEDGVASLVVDSDADRWEVSAWSPRFRDARMPLVQSVESRDDLAVTFALGDKLRPPHRENSESMQWDDY